MAYDKVEGLLDDTDTTDAIIGEGQFDVVVEGLTSGSIKLQYKLPKVKDSVIYDPDWVDFPDGEFVTDVYKTVFISEAGVFLRALGSGNNSGVYVRIAKHLIR